WADCDGRLIPIQRYTALYSLIGTAYGGEGKKTFGLPDLRGGGLVCSGPLPRGETHGTRKLAGGEGGLVAEGKNTRHVHRMAATSNPGTVNDPSGNLLAQAGAGLLAESVKGYIYYTDQPGSGTELSTRSVSSNNTMPHNNMQPSLVLRYCIALQGIFPPRAA